MPDLVIEWQGRLLPIKIKSSTRPRVRDTRGLHTFRVEYPEASLPGLLLHDGDTIEWIADGVLAVPWWRVV